MARERLYGSSERAVQAQQENMEGI